MIRILALMACSTLSPTSQPIPAVESPMVGHAQAVAPTPTDAAGFPVPTEGLVIPGGLNRNEDWTLERLAKAYGEATGQYLVYDRDTGSLLQATMTSLPRDMTVAPGKLHTVVESLLLRNDFVLTLVHAEAPRIIGVKSLNTGARVQLRASAAYLAEEELPDWSGHPAYLVQTVIHLDRLDVRTLSNSMRTMMTDANTQNVIPVGTSNSLILVGFADRVIQLARMLKDINAKAPEPQELTVPAGQAQKPEAPKGGR